MGDLSAWEKVKKALAKLKSELWDSDVPLMTRAKGLITNAPSRQFSDLQVLMKTHRPSKITTGQWLGAAGLTLAFAMTPLTLLMRKSWFERFCDFHVRVLRLKGRRPGSLAGMAVLTSLVYSSLALPVYAGGILWIFGVKSGSELRLLFNDSLLQKYTFDTEVLSDPSVPLTADQREKMQRNKDLLKYFDEVVVFGLDHNCGIEESATAQFLEEKFHQSTPKA